VGKKKERARIEKIEKREKRYCTGRMKANESGI